MWFDFRGKTKNPWLEQDRQDQRRVIVTVLIFAAFVLTGIGLLVYAILRD